MYCRNADFGRIRFKCTENELKTLSEDTFQRYLARKSGFICPSVQNSEISSSHSRSVRRAQRRSLRPFRMPFRVSPRSSVPPATMRPARHRPLRPVAAIFLVRKQKSWLLCNFFAIRDSFLSPKSGNGSFLRLISCTFVLRSAIGGHATIPNRKKVAIWAAILFLGFRSGLGAAHAESIAVRERRRRHGAGLMDIMGYSGRRLEAGSVALLIDEARYCVPHPPPCFPCRCSMPAHCCHPRFHSILLWRGLPSWQNWSTLKKPVVQGVSLKELARASALGD